MISATLRENLSSGFLRKRILNKSPSYKIKISPVASLNLILSKKRITKALIRLRGCADWFVVCCSQTPKDRFPRVEAHMFTETVTVLLRTHNMSLPIMHSFI